VKNDSELIDFLIGELAGSDMTKSISIESFGFFKLLLLEL